MTSRQFEQFVATERGMLVRLAMNILHHPEDADDAVAEALCKAWERREQLRSPDKMRSWVAKITVNTALSMIQKRKREELVESMDDYPTNEASGYPHSGIWHEIESLAEQDRTLVYLYYIYGFSQKEISAILNIPTGTVKSRLYAARQKLNNGLWKEVNTMRSRLDREISRRLLQEVPTEPTVKNSRIDQLLCRVRAEDVQDNSKVVRAFSYRTAVAAVGAAIMLTTGTYAAVDNYHEHLQSMSQEEQKQLNHMTQAQREDADHYSRKLSFQEQKRKELLQKEYKKGTLPETKLKEVDSQKEVKANGGKEVVYCRANSTFYLPKSELTDEQLLQIIDFNERRDYALAKQNQADRARAAQRPVDETANKLTEDQAIEAAKQYVSKIYGIDTNQARAAVDVPTYEDSEDDEYNIVLKKKGWKYEYSVAVKINSGEINQSAISEGDKWISASDASYRKGIERKYLRTVQQMMDKIAPNQSIKSIYGISRFDKQNLLLYGEITYYVRSEDGVTYVIKYAPSDKCLTGVFVHKDFHELWQQMKREKKQDQKEGINTIIEKCY